MPQDNPLKAVEVVVIHPGVEEEVRFTGRYSVPFGLPFAFHARAILEEETEVVAKEVGGFAKV